MGNRDPRFDPDFLTFLDERYSRKDPPKTPKKPRSNNHRKPNPCKASTAPKSPKKPAPPRFGFRLFCALVDLAFFCVISAKSCRY